MTNTLLGIPLTFWGVGCLAIAGAYYWFWPQQGPQPLRVRTTWQHLVLRYGHALVWVLLAGGCFAGAFGYGVLGIILALAAVPVYIVFLAMVMKDRQEELAAMAAKRRADAEQQQTISTK